MPWAIQYLLPLRKVKANHHLKFIKTKSKLYKKVPSQSFPRKCVKNKLNHSLKIAKDYIMKKMLYNRILRTRNQWPVPTILLFTKNADYENEKCPKVKVFICNLHSKLKKGFPFLKFHWPFWRLEKKAPFSPKKPDILGFVFDIKWTNFLD